MQIPLKLAPAALLVLSTLPIAQASVPTLYQPEDESYWIVEQSGRVLGYSWWRYAGEGERGGEVAYHFEGQVHFDLGTSTQRFTTELWVDAAGRPFDVDYRGEVAGTFAGLQVAFAGGKADARIQQGESRQNATVNVPTDALPLVNNFAGMLELAIAMHRPASGASTSISMVSINTLRPFALDVRHERDTDDGFVVSDSLGEELEFSSDGRLQRITIAQQGVSFERTEGSPERFTIARPALPGSPSDLPREDVTISLGDDVTLAGSVTRPPDVDESDRVEGAVGAGPKERLPAVLFLSGSGAQDRDGGSPAGNIGTYEILDWLTEKGFLVLRVDDRGAGESTGPVLEMTFDDIVADARGWLSYLRSRPDVDPSRIALIGHSEGGVVATVLAAEGPGVGAIVLMASPGRNVIAILKEQLVAQRRRAGTSEPAIASFEAEFDAFVAKVRNGEPIEVGMLPPDLQPFGVMAPWVKSHLDVEPAQLAQAVTCPVLVLQGVQDVQVRVDEDCAALESALRAAEHPDYRVVIFPNLGHLFHGRTKRADAKVDDGFLGVLARWLRERFLPEEAVNDPKPKVFGRADEDEDGGSGDE